MDYELVNIKEINQLPEIIFLNYLTYKLEKIEKKFIFIVKDDREKLFYLRYIFKTFQKIDLEYLKNLLFQYQLGIYRRYEKELDTIRVSELNERLEKILEVLIYSEDRLENVNWGDYYVFISSKFSIDTIKKNILKSIIHSLKNIHKKCGYFNQVLIYTYIDDMKFKEIYKFCEKYKKKRGLKI